MRSCRQRRGAARRPRLFAALALLLLGPWAACFAQKGFGKPRPPRVIEAEVVSELLPADVVDLDAEPEMGIAPVAPAEDAAFDLVVVGAGATGLWFTLLMVGLLQKMVRVRIYEPRLEREEGTWRWKEEAKKRGHRAQAAGIAEEVWKALPPDVAKVVFEEFEEVDGVRNVNVGVLEEALLRAAQIPAFFQVLEVIPRAYNQEEHARVCLEGPCDIIIAADGRNAEEAAEVLHDNFKAVLPLAWRGGDLEALDVAFDVSRHKCKPLDVAASTAVSRAQQRYAVTWTGKKRGTLHMRLTPEEAKTAAAPSLARLCEDDTPLWRRLREGLRLFGIPVKAVQRLGLQSFDGMLRPSFHEQLLGKRSANLDAPMALLLGDAAGVGNGHLGPMLGTEQGVGCSLRGAHSLAMLLWSRGEWWNSAAFTDHVSVMGRLRGKGQACATLGAAQLIEAGLKGCGEGAEAFLANLRFSMERLEKEGAALPSFEELQAEVLSRDLEEETFSVLSSTGPWLPGETVAKVDDTSIIDMGGKTPEGMAMAKQLLPAAKAGDGAALEQLGIMFFTANGVEKDYHKALKFLRRAAKAGQPNAMNIVGFILRNGVGGLPMDKAGAVHWTKAAAEMGNGEARYNIAEMYEEGDGVKQDDLLAYGWYKAASKAGIPEAKLKMSDFLFAGRVEKDEELAAKLVRQAAEEGVMEAKERLATLLFVGDSIHVPRDKEEAAALFKEAAEAGRAVAQYSLGVMLELGDGVEKDVVAGQHWLRTAAANGLLEAQVRCREQLLLAPPRA